MNKLETKYFQWCLQLKEEGFIREFWFQPNKWRLADLTYYTPDFLVILLDGSEHYVDTKQTRKDKNRKSEEFPDGVEFPFREDDASVKMKWVSEKYWPYDWWMAYWSKYQNQWLHQPMGLHTASGDWEKQLTHLPMRWTCEG
jgi:hypothetical protein